MKTFFLLFSLLASALGGTVNGSNSTKSFMSDKTEVPVNLEVSGAEALCQTEDGYVWIGQYSGLTRYDSQEYVTYKSFVEDGQEYSIINVKALASKENTLYIATTQSVFVHRDYQFSHLDIDAGIIKTITLDDANDLLYVSSQTKGALVYDLKTNEVSSLPGVTAKSINDIALDPKRNNYYYQQNEGVFDKNGKEIYLYPKILDIYTYGDILYIGEMEGIIHRYNMAEEEFLQDLVVSDQVNKMLYSEADQTLFVACEKNGLYCVSFAGETPQISLAGDLENKSQLVDLMVDYEGNLWVASHYIGASGVSIITKNALLELLYDDVIWKTLEVPPNFDRNIYAIERYGDILYIVAGLRIYRYDLIEGKILPDNAIMEALDAFTEQKNIEGRAGGDENYQFTYSPKDAEIFQDKLYFAVSSVGLVEYDPHTDVATIFDVTYIADHVSKLVGEPLPEIALTNTMRCLRSFGTYLAIGYTRGLMKFDGTDFAVMYVGSNVLYINASKDGKLIFDRTAGLYEVDDEFTKYTEIPTVKNISGNRLKFLVDGDYIYYTLNSRLFRLKQENGAYVSEEVAIPYVKGSLVELSKIEYDSKDGNTDYKYVIASQTQIYITDSLEGERLKEYEFYDSTNGLQSIIANTSGYYDRQEQKYYFQSTNGIFVYDFHQTRGTATPVKVAVSSVQLDGQGYYGDSINITKEVYRVTVNISIFGFRPNKGYTIYYKMDGIDNDYHIISDNERTVNFTNLPGGEYTFHAYALDEYGQASNQVEIHLVKERHFYEQVGFWVLIGVWAVALLVALIFGIINRKTQQALKKQLEYKNITVESIQAIARTIDAKDEYTNGHSIRVGYYSKIIAQNLGLSEDEVDNIYYIALLHDIGKIAIPDKILNKPGKLTDEEFAIMKSHTTRGAKILKGISTIPHIVEGAKYHHEKYDGTGYPEGLKGEEIPYVARIICCADCFDAMASKRVYKKAFTLETIMNEFKRCAGTQFDPDIAKVVVEMMASGKLKPYAADNTYLGDDGKTHRITKNAEDMPSDPAAKQNN